MGIWGGREVLETVSGWGVEDGAKNASAASHGWLNKELISQPATRNIILGCRYEEAGD